MDSSKSFTSTESLTDFCYLHSILVIFGGGDGLMGLARTALPAIESVSVENENIVQVEKSIYNQCIF